VDPEQRWRRRGYHGDGPAVLLESQLGVSVEEDRQGPSQHLDCGDRAEEHRETNFHHSAIHAQFLVGRSPPIGPPLQLTFAQNVSDYTEPGVVSQWAWAKPLSDYFEPIAANTLNATVPESPLSAEPPRIKAELAGSSNVDSRASYVASVGDLTVVSKLTPGRLPLYAYNLYVEETAICPEPMQMIELAPSETITWTQQLFFGKFEPVDEGTGRACRGADAEDDSPSYYEDHAHIESLNECKGLCLTQGDCVGVEYSRTTAYGQCKVWIREAGIGASKAVSGSTCVRLVPPASAQQ